MSAGSRGERLRLGVVGCGRVFERYHLPALRRSRDWEIAAVCDRLPERLDRARGACPGATGEWRAVGAGALAERRGQS